MFTTGSKLYFGLGTLSLIAAAAYGYGAHGGLSGVLTLGLSGGVGESTGYVVLLFVATVSFFVGGAVVAFRDADAESVVQIAQLDTVPDVDAPSNPSYWPAVGAVAAGLIVIGLVDNTQIFLLGCVVALVVLLEWMVSAWSDRASGDAAANRRIRNRLMYPLEIPVFAAIGIAALVLCVSRVLLALTETGAVVAAGGFAAVVLACAAFIAASPKATRGVLAGACVLLAVGVLAGGLVATTNGERKVEIPEQTDAKFKPPDRIQPVEAPLEQGGATTTTTTTVP
ncbi:MAG: hypothetical protein QOE63_248 [Acidimicrobiaceae bacterium]|jgi:hypothetical protein